MDVIKTLWPWFVVPPLAVLLVGALFGLIDWLDRRRKTK